MGFLRDITDNDSEIDIQKVQNEFAKILVANEQVEKAYKLNHDLFIFTNHRLILVDKQGVTVKTLVYHSIPFRNITHFSIETAGHFDLEAELKIWVSGDANPITKQFDESLDVYELQSVLAEYVFQP
ncbi:hypothetical protein SPSYN_01648 [Sporotomaculum syntrophicum]|uniref:Bacterial Pleckstrin homology domain-containing protein n=1 Tax=Sporotomaculum syntrophicum TaxID=182264 RepID=A0A9D2WRC8_9FIRM|nr:PH domain-containing protein [Sporotomaculum syntrophicum]KAF1085506.1 hypothetical protein SPSYN_01648 [Sporotomaculum syntrophicum]